VTRGGRQQQQLSRRNLPQRLVGGEKKYKLVRTPNRNKQKQKIVVARKRARVSVIFPQQTSKSDETWMTISPR